MTLVDDGGKCQLMVEQCNGMVYVKEKHWEADWLLTDAFFKLNAFLCNK